MSRGKTQHIIYIYLMFQRPVEVVEVVSGPFPKFQLKICGWMPGAHRSCSITPLISWTEKRKYNEGLWVKMKTERDHRLITVTSKTDSTWEMSLIYYQSNQTRIMRDKTKS